MAETWEDCAAAAAEIARAAGALIRSRYAEPREIGTKSRSVDLVTDTDRAADRLITQGLHARFPGHGTISEEGGLLPPVSGSRDERSSPIWWVVDPLDGTTNFAHGVPQFAVSIAAVAGLDPIDPLAATQPAGARTVVGVVYDPMRDEMFTATESGPATRNGASIEVSRERDLDSCLIATGFPYDRREHVDRYLDVWREVMPRCRDLRRLGAAALDLAWVACGRLDAFWEYGLHAWDIAAGSLVVRRAGGRATDFDARDLVVEARESLATNGHVHDALLAILRGRRTATLT